MLLLQLVPWTSIDNMLENWGKCHREGRNQGRNLNRRRRHMVLVEDHSPSREAHRYREFLQSAFFFLFIIHSYHLCYFWN